MLEKLQEIVRGNFYRLIGKNSDLYQRRYSHCGTCPFNSKNKKDLSDLEWLWSFLGDFCTKCGCPLKSKLVEPNTECPLLKWEAEANYKTKTNE